MQRFEVEDAVDSQDLSGSRTLKGYTAGKSGRFGDVQSSRTVASARSVSKKVTEPARLPVTKRTYIGWICLVVCIFALCCLYGYIHGGEKKPPDFVLSPRLKEIAKEVFELHDIDHNRHLEVAELVEAVSALGIMTTTDQMNVIMDFFNKGDAEMGRQSSGVTLPEFYRMLACGCLGNLEVKQQDLRFTFALLDRDATNKISASELVQAAKDIGATSTRKELTKIIQEFDLEEDDMLDFDEFKSLVEAVKSRSSHIATVIQRILSDISMIVFFNRGLKRGGLVMVDAAAGSTKLWSFNDYGERSTVDVTTSCSGEDGDFPEQGLAALAYDQRKCQAHVETTFPTDETYGMEKSTVLKINKDESRYKFATRILKNLATMHENRKNCIRNSTDQCPQANNRAKIPIMGTGEMRLLSLTSNIIVWASVCGARDPTGQYQFASKGKRCGTIPGTDEAWFEFIANIGQGVSRRLTATISVGTHSAQIALPLRDPEELYGFEELMKRVKNKLGDCSGLLMPGSDHRLPIFNKGALDNREECFRDFIDMRDVSTMHLSKEDFQVSGLESAKAIGLISFLGVGSDNVAGGVMSIETWAKANDCGAADPGEVGDQAYAYDSCKASFDKALQKDWFFSDIKEFFANTPLTVKDYNLWSPKARSAEPFLAEMSDGAELEDVEESQGDRINIGEELLTRVQDRCSGDKKNSRWGQDDRITCMSATYIALFLKCFFPNADEDKKMFFTSVPWIAGLYHNMLGEKQEALKRSIHEW